jgi:hypothetical protein
MQTQIRTYHPVACVRFPKHPCSSPSCYQVRHALHSHHHAGRIVTPRIVEACQLAVDLRLVGLMVPHKAEEKRRSTAKVENGLEVKRIGVR